MMTVNGVTTTRAPGQEQYQEYRSRVNKKVMVQYDYRDIDGQLFSVIRPTLSACRTERDAWLKTKGVVLQ